MKKAKGPQTSGKTRNKSNGKFSNWSMVRDGPRIESRWTLSKSILGIEAPFVDGTSRAGSYRDLPAGAQILVCGGGFDEHTVKVLCNDKYYFVYASQLADAGDQNPARNS